MKREGQKKKDEKELETRYLEKTAQESTCDPCPVTNTVYYVNQTSIYVHVHARILNTSKIQIQLIFYYKFTITTYILKHMCFLYVKW